VFKYSGITIVVALLFVAGCAAPPSQPVPREWSINGQGQTNNGLNIGVSNRVVAPVNLHPVPPAAPKPVQAYPVTNPIANIRPPVPINTWTSLSRWAAIYHLGQPERLTDSPLATYAIRSSRGELIVAIGSRDASWNGRQFHLGFDPEMVDGDVFMHGLDLQKNLEPLLCDRPLSFGNDSVIVLDPGHGGMNSGTISVLDHRPEKEFTLDLAKRLKPLLEQQGWTVYLTRTDDYDLALSNRVRFAESHHADLFISLHFNSAAPDRKQAGLETYCLTPTGMPSTLTRGFADLWQEYLPNNLFDVQNLQLAVRLHTALLRATGEEDRGVRRARFIGVLRGQKRPAILIEGGYLSNPAEAAKIENPDFRQKLAVAIAGALSRDRQGVVQVPITQAAGAGSNAVTQ
jgi:N-acetylmuramoyl-L-alanine amidase